MIDLSVTNFGQEILASPVVPAHLIHYRVQLLLQFLNVLLTHVLLFGSSHYLILPEQKSIASGVLPDLHIQFSHRVL